MATQLDPPPAQESVDDGLDDALRMMNLEPKGVGRLKLSLRWLKWFNDLRNAVNTLIAGGGGGGSGTVTSVAGSVGPNITVTITGTPTVAPVVNATITSLPSNLKEPWQHKLCGGI